MKYDVKRASRFISLAVSFLLISGLMLAERFPQSVSATSSAEILRTDIQPFEIADDKFFVRQIFNAGENLFGANSGFESASPTAVISTRAKLVSSSESTQRACFR